MGVSRCQEVRTLCHELISEITGAFDRFNRSNHVKPMSPCVELVSSRFTSYTAATFPYDGLKYLFNLRSFLEPSAMLGVHFDFDNVPVRKVPGLRQLEFLTMSRL